MQQNRIKLLKFVPNFGVGGTERQFANLALALDPSRFELSFACLRRWGKYLDVLEPWQRTMAEYKIQSLYYPHSFAQQLRLARSLRRDRIQILHTYNFYANVFAIPAAWLAGVAVIVASIRETGAYLTPMQKRVQKFVCRYADCVLVNADAVKQWLLAQGYRREQIVVIRNGIDLSRFVTRNGSGQLRQELGLPARAPLVAVLARLNQMKGIEYFLEAAAVIAGRCPDARFLIVGSNLIPRDDTAVEDVAYRRALESSVVRLGLDGRVVFTGMRLDVPEILSALSVSVLPSLSEGLSNTLLESMAAGVPVVATRVGGNPEIVEEGVTGFLVPPRDPAALAKAVCQLLENPELASRFGQAGRQRVVECFSLERMVRETERLYLSLLNQARHGETSIRDKIQIRSSCP